MAGTIDEIREICKKMIEEKGINDFDMSFDISDDDMNRVIRISRTYKTMRISFRRNTSICTIFIGKKNEDFYKDFYKAIHQINKKLPQNYKLNNITDLKYLLEELIISHA